MAQNASEMEEKLESHQQAGRTSTLSDGDFESVAEMREHLKHARQIVIQFIQKTPYSDDKNESTLPVVYSMFEFTKQEQDSVKATRETFNAEYAAAKKDKSVFNKMFKSKKTSGTSGSFASGGNSTQHSNK